MNFQWHIEKWAKDVPTELAAILYKTEETTTVPPTLPEAVTAARNLFPLLVQAVADTKGLPKGGDKEAEKAAKKKAKDALRGLEAFIKKHESDEAAPTVDDERGPVDVAHSINISRPHTLLTQSPRFSAQLEYRYDDTNEVVSVPHLWYNRPYTESVFKLEEDAKREELYATQIDKIALGYDPLTASPQQKEEYSTTLKNARKHRERAEDIRAYAARMEEIGSPTHPVAASHLAYAAR